ncbi:MAG: hypothetical protein JRJ20_16185 [Deltaproteobacteria bacterium]|nr:hypothetical protein [Deltaproteobacteria bacterium]
MKKRMWSYSSLQLTLQTKIVWLGIQLIVLSTCGFITLSWGQDAGSPQIVIPEKTFRSDLVEQGQDIEHTFTILNKGREPLQIIKVKPG